MLGCGESQKEVIRPDFKQAIMVDFQRATISWDTGFILRREIDEGFGVIDPMKDGLEDLRSPTQLSLDKGHEAGASQSMLSRL